MRELLNDLENGHQLSDPDPVRRAQNQMRTPLPKRFYEAVSVAEADGDDVFVVHLDGRPVRTPTANLLRLPTRRAASLVAEEFAAQGETIDPATMPVTRLVNTAVDGVAAAVDAVFEDILRFAGTDLVCYRADAPHELVERQAEAWDPVLDWVRAETGARFILAEGVMHVAQPRESIALIGAHLRHRREPYRLAALHVMTSLTGSALIALGVEGGALDATAAWRAAHVDEDWNIHQWGEDAEASARRAARERDFRASVALLDALD